ncbi:ABC transporter permease [Halomonas sp. V046]|uniref:ABC transporter permease n=1 Tax=Halomonas sp. V046 TaxID=3459611 RepID=UPI0040443061
MALMGAALVAWWTLPSVTMAPNRIVPGTAYAAREVAGWGPAILASLPLAAAAWLARDLDRHRLKALLALVVAGLVGLPLWLTAASVQLVDPNVPQARIGIGAGLWLTLFMLLLSLVELRTRLVLPSPVTWGVALLPLVVFVLCLPLGLDGLALWQEYAGRRQDFIAAIGEHLLLVGATVAISLVLGAVIALLMRRYPSVQRLGFSLLNFLQTVPSLALFGLLLGPLAWLSDRYAWLDSLGVSGIGWAPALIALVAYSLLPMVRNAFVALEGVDPGVVESARGMGMSRLQSFLQVRLPLALPVLLEGVRITTVQAIGLTAVAALIGAGGLGRFIFQGLGQAAMDLVLLGALPILLMAVVADALLGNLANRLRKGEPT